MILGSIIGVASMLGVKRPEGVARGSLGLLAAIDVDDFIDGLVLGLGFVAGQREGLLLLTAALTLEILFLGPTVTAELSEQARYRALATTTGLALLLPVGATFAILAQIRRRCRLDRSCRIHSCPAGRAGKSAVPAAGGVRSRSPISRFISPISRTCASMMPSASMRTRGSLMWARSLVMIAIE